MNQNGIIPESSQPDNDSIMKVTYHICLLNQNGMIPESNEYWIKMEWFMNQNGMIHESFSLNQSWIKVEWFMNQNLVDAHEPVRMIQESKFLNQNKMILESLFLNHSWIKNNDSGMIHESNANQKATAADMEMIHESKWIDSWIKI